MEHAYSGAVTVTVPQPDSGDMDSGLGYQLLFDSNPAPMWVYDFDTLRFLAVNDAALEHYGYTRDEFLGMTIADIRPADDIPRLLGAVEQARTTGRPPIDAWP